MYEENDTLITLVSHDLSQFIIIPIKELVRVIYVKNKIYMCMIAEIITFDGRKFKLGDNRTTSIKWSDKYGCFLINNSVRVYIENIKSLTCGDK